MKTGVLKMTTIKSLEEMAVKYGKSYFFAAFNGALLAGGTIDVCLDSTIAEIYKYFSINSCGLNLNIR